MVLFIVIKIVPNLYLKIKFYKNSSSVLGLPILVIKRILHKMITQTKFMNSLISGVKLIVNSYIKASTSILILQGKNLSFF